MIGYFSRNGELFLCKILLRNFRAGDSVSMVRGYDSSLANDELYFFITE